MRKKKEITYHPVRVEKTLLEAYQRLPPRARRAADRDVEFYTEDAMRHHTRAAQPPGK